MSESGIPPSGSVPFYWHYKSQVNTSAFDKASDAFDRALLKTIGLPDSMDIRIFENTLAKMTGEITKLASAFSVSALIAILPNIIIDGTELWAILEPKFKDKITRQDFITKVIRYAYKKANPDLPFLVEPFETMVENMILDAIPGMLDNLDKKLEELLAKFKLFVK